MPNGFLGGLLGGLGGGAIGSALVSLQLDSRQYEAQLATQQQKTQTSANAMGSSFGKFGAVAKAGLALGGVALAGFAVSAVKAASDLGESLNKARVVFGQASDSVIAFSETSASSFGIAQAEALEAAAGFGAMAQSAGLSEAASGDMSIALVKLAADMASFNNQDPSEMLERLRSGLAGEAEPLRRFGVFISEARVKTEAYRLGLAAAGEELTDAQKVQARYNIILQDTTKQQGDFARTVGESLPNQIRVLKAEFIDLAADIGEVLIPAVLEVVKVFGAVISGARDAAEALRDPIRVAQEHEAAFKTATESLEGLQKAYSDGSISALEFVESAKKVSEQSGIQLDFSERIVEAYRIQKTESDRLTAAAEAYARGAGESAEATDEMAESHRDAAAAARDQRSAELALTDSFLGLLDTAKQVQETQAEVTRLQRQGKEGTERYSEAVIALFEDQLSLDSALLKYAEDLVEGDARQKDVIQTVKQMGREFGISNETVQEIITSVKALIREGERYNGQVWKATFLADFPPDVVLGVTTPTEVRRRVQAQAGMHETLREDTLILAHRGERVDIGSGIPGITVVINGDVSGEEVVRKVEDALVTKLARAGAIFNGAVTQ